MASPGPHSGLIIEVPEAEPAVRGHRERLDASAPLGVPAHITVLFPFMRPETITTAELTQLGQLFADVSRFRFRLDHTDWFGEDVLWLAPRDPGPFRALTQRVFRAFPAFPPFEGQFDDIVPHLTIGHGHPLNSLRAAEDSVQAHLPIDACAAAVTLMTQRSARGRWTKAATFTLGGVSALGGQLSSRHPQRLPSADRSTARLCAQGLSDLPLASGEANAQGALRAFGGETIADETCARAL